MARAEAKDALPSPKSSSVLAPSQFQILSSSSRLYSLPRPSSALLSSALQGEMSRLPLPSPARTEATTCGSLLQELQDLWDEIGENDRERDRTILQLEQECLDLYRRKVDQTRKHKAELHQMLAEGEAEVSNLISILGERETFVRLEKTAGTLKEQLAMIKPLLDDLGQKKEQRMKEFLDVQLQIVRICAEIAGNIHQGSSTSPQNLRLQKVGAYIKLIQDLSLVLSVDFYKMISGVHPTFGDSANNLTESISNDTLARLAGIVHSLEQEKLQRLQKLQNLGSTLVELWNLMDMPMDEQKRFDHVTCLISSSVDSVLAKGCLALELIDQVEHEVERLNVLKASKMKELVLKRQNELDEIYRSVHMDVDGEGAREKLLGLIDSGKVDLAELLSSMDNQTVKAKEQALSRKDILEKVEKWTFASEEENWLDDYEKDENRYAAGRGVHKNLKRAEKARILVNKIPSLVENLASKIKTWENEKGMPFMYDKVRLLDSLENYVKLRQQREEEKRRFRERKKLQEQFATEQEALFGSKPSPMRQFPMKKPLGQSSSVNIACGTPTGRRVSTPFGRQGIVSSGKEKKGGKGSVLTPDNYVSLQKDDSVSHNSSIL
ncbi:Microtubule associated protein (MAP65/ASE1 family) [Musa troglodytarum]|uniref:Microtubule associated protein (MAP65/ASE1 family) n=1 Tax=Musa troglodytarum TaxID=320322 RepID=A0A9E7HYU7_9LILI|nr:Microtubule associated protein (MAP65/ASE1 family) [Musa troglodytarum]